MLGQPTGWPGLCLNVAAKRRAQHRAAPCHPLAAVQNDGMNHAVIHNSSASRFEGAFNGELAVCNYQRQGDVLLLVHTEVPTRAQGSGLAGALVQAALDWARDQGLKVRPRCSYVASYMRRHPATLALLEPA